MNEDCLECSSAYHVVLVSPASESSESPPVTSTPTSAPSSPPAHRPLKLFEQFHCARCWRPLVVATSWPGSRLDKLPPYAHDTSLRVANCGHVFHGMCALEVDRCPACRDHIRNLHEIHVIDRANGEVEETFGNSFLDSEYSALLERLRRLREGDVSESEDRRPPVKPYFLPLEKEDESRPPSPSSEKQLEPEEDKPSLSDQDLPKWALLNNGSTAETVVEESDVESKTDFSDFDSKTDFSEMSRDESLAEFVGYIKDKLNNISLEIEHIRKNFTAVKS